MDQPSTDYNDSDTSEYLMTDDSSNERQRFFLFTAMAVLAVVVVGALFIWLLLFRGQTDEPASLAGQAPETQQVTSGETSATDAETVTISSEPASLLPSTLTVGQQAPTQDTTTLPDTGSATPIATASLLSLLAATGHYSYGRLRAKRQIASV